MARTYGEILPESFGAVFEPCTTGKTVFVDIGSGHGLITVAAVQDYGCSFAIGIEKYRSGVIIPSPPPPPPSFSPPTPLNAEE